MSIGQNAPIDGDQRFGALVKDLQRRIAELERVNSIPAAIRELAAAGLTWDDEQRLRDADGRAFVRTLFASAAVRVHDYGRAAVATDGTGLMSVTFNGTFAAPPIVTVEFVRNAGALHTAMVTSVTSTGFNVRLFRENLQYATETVGEINWTADWFAP